MKILVLSGALLALAAPAAMAQQPAYGAPLSVEQAQKVIAAGVAEAKRQNLNQAFAVVEPTGALVAFYKMDGTQYGAIHASQDKAVTAAEFRRSTKAVAEAIVANPGVMTLRVNGVEGGLPIFVGGKVVGALGISGGTAVQDGQLAQAVLTATGFNARP